MPLVLVRVECRISNMRDCLQQLFISMFVKLAVKTLRERTKDATSAIYTRTGLCPEYLHVIEL
jgi:hypothetical protein